MRNLLIEIGTEDLPASKCKDILNQLKSNLPSILKNYRLSFKNIEYFLTHRRISTKIQEVSEYQIEEKVERRGPP
ncbi:MAG: glycine--tRNA ligase subunit beta, partial [bacterium]